MKIKIRQLLFKKALEDEAEVEADELQEENAGKNEQVNYCFYYKCIQLFYS